VLLGHDRLVERLGLLRHALQPALGLLEVRVQELGLDRLDVGERVHAPLGMHNLGVLVRADHVEDRVGLPDVAEELVAEPLALMGAAYEPRDVVELDHLVHDWAGANRLGHAVEALVRDAYHCHVRLERGERVVGLLGPGPGQRVEERRLPGVGEPDDPDLHAAQSNRSNARPSRAPATTSDG
jgi:hypothetical protein